MKITSENLRHLAWDKSGGLLPAIVQDANNGTLLMQAWMTVEALEQTLRSGRVTFFSRSRGELWEKGRTSGNTLVLAESHGDCDGDSLKILAEPAGPSCHSGEATCWGDDPGFTLSWLNQLELVIEDRKGSGGDESYTGRLFRQGTRRIAQKVGEEGVETALAAVSGDRDELLNESADLVYHLLVLLNEKGLSLSDVANVLQERHGR